ncbi:MAG: ketopantoate reductase family protein, partial [Gemmiger sp.]|nr:ketopantoate reductase family protein [Gemmiger sp.]
MKIQSVAILGAGAVGCYVLWGLADKAAANTLQLGVVAEGSRAERLRQNGCTINGQVYHPQVWTPQQAHGVDLLIVALKYGALPGALDSIRTIVSERTVVMSLMNGVDSEELIAAQVGAAHVLPALIKVASHRTEDGVRFDPETTIGIIYGELTAPFDSDRVQAVRALFADTGIHFRVTEHIREEIWSKFRLNVCNNLPQAILGAGVGCYSDSAHIKAISDGLRRELE